MAEQTLVSQLQLTEQALLPCPSWFFPALPQLNDVCLLLGTPEWMQCCPRGPEERGIITSLNLPADLLPELAVPSLHRCREFVLHRFGALHSSLLDSMGFLWC